MNTEKEKKLLELFDEIENDTSLPIRESNLVFGEGNSDCEVMFIGEAPGQKEDELKRPFVGRAGQVLNKVIEREGWKRENVYITNIVKRRPPGNRDPFPEEIEAYKPYLTKQIAVIRPKIIATLGRFAMNYFLPAAKMMRDQGKVFKVNSLLVVPLLHPAAALRSNAMMNEFVNSFKKIPLIIKKYDSLIASVSSAEKNREADSDLSHQSALL